MYFLVPARGGFVAMSPHPSGTREMGLWDTAIDFNIQFQYTNKMLLFDIILNYTILYQLVIHIRFQLRGSNIISSARSMLQVDMSNMGSTK